jgi:hypothetical protein
MGDPQRPGASAATYIQNSARLDFGYMPLYHLPCGDVVVIPVVSKLLEGKKILFHITIGKLYVVMGQIIGTSSVIHSLCIYQIISHNFRFHL